MMYQVTTMLGTSVMEICAINIKWMGEDEAVRFIAWMKVRMEKTEEVNHLSYAHGYSKVRKQFYDSVSYVKLSEGECPCL